MEKRYGALRFIAVVHKFAAVVVAVLGIVAARGAGAWGPAPGVVAIAASGVVALLLWAIAESILVIIDIEENTRRTANRSGGVQSATERVPLRPLERPDELVIRPKQT